MIRYLLFAVYVLAIAAPGVFAQDAGWARHKRMFAVPVPGKVTIDGKLDDWDLSGALKVYVMAATKDVQSGNYAVMYDADALYLGAEVRDPTPMMNRHSPEAEGDMAWDADACQFRLVVDAKVGYPVTDASWNVTLKEQLVHLLLWYYTDRQEPNLQMKISMGYQDPPGTEKFGVVKKDKFQAVYRLADDKKGYTFEYRIPWSTLGAKVPLNAGDMVAANLQFQWGRADGLKTAGISAWAYDLMSYANFPYANAGCWGKLIFSKEGHLPREMVEEGMPPEKPLPLTFTYDLPEESVVTVALINDKHEIVRTLTAAEPRLEGRVTEKWDGLDDQDRPLPAGKYTWKGLYHQPVTTQYVLSVHNSGDPAWKNDANTGGWGGDHGVPIAITNAGTDLVMTWDYAEAGWGQIRTDGEGKKKWGTWHMGTYLASDGTRIFNAESDGVRCYEVKDGRPLPYGNGAAMLAPPAGASGVSGLACQDGKLYVSFSSGIIGIYDPVQGTLLGSWDVPAPGYLAPRPGGGLVTISAGKLVTVQDGKVALLAEDHLDKPQGVAIDAVGTIYVANRGKLQNVSVFSADGKYLKSIGKDGGRPLIGRYNPTGMLEPAGVAIDAKGRLWVMEAIDSPKRVSVWDTQTGQAVKEFFGDAHYSAFIWMDPEHPDEVYCDGALWKVDLDKKTSYPLSTAWRPRNPDMPGSLQTHGNGLHMFTAKNGKQYGYAGDGYNSEVLFMRDGDVFKPLLAFIWTKGQPAVTKMYTAEPNGATYAWVDKNGDQTVQTEEVLLQELGKSWYRGFSCVDRDLNLWHPSGEVFRPLRIEADGRPVYDFTKPEKAEVPGITEADPADGSLYVLSDAGSVNGVNFARFQPDGTLLWGYKGAVSAPDSLNLPPQRLGKLWGPTVELGAAGDFTGFATYFGTHHIYTNDGLAVAMIFRDPRMGGELGPDIIASENYNGQLVKPKGMNRYFALGGDQDGRITEVFGLDTVKRLPGGEYTITDADAKKVADAQAEYQAKLAKGQKLTIVRGRKLLDEAQPVAKSVNATQSFQARAAYDAQNLYVKFEVTSPAELNNNAADPQLLFKGGNCLDIQLAADPKADPKRDKPVAGDVRILVTRQNGKPFAVLYRPKVKDFKGEPFVLKSPTGQESFDVIETTDKIGLEYARPQTQAGFTAIVTIPLALLGLTLQPGAMVQIDLGYIYGNIEGTKAMMRSYWSNNGFSANVLNDVPNESRLTPNEWGQAEVE